jgi:hypothetical protein
MQYSVRKGESLEMIVVARRCGETMHPLHALWAKDWHVGKFLIELARVETSAYVRVPWSWNFSIRKFIPLNVGKENVGFNIFSVVRTAAESLGRILRQ